MEWSWGPGETSVVGYLFGLHDGEEVGPLGEFRWFWHAGKAKMMAYLFGWGGVVGVRPLERAGEHMTTLLQTLFNPGGASWRSGHRTERLDGEERGASFKVGEDGTWTEDRSYLRIRQDRSYTTPPMSIRLTILCIGLLVSSAAAQTENTLTLAEGDAGQPASIEDVAFIVGHWQGEGLGGFNEEVWGMPLGGSMIGIFRHLQDEEPSFSEIMQIAEENGTLALRLKHFNPDLTGWETKDEMVTFPLVRVEPGEAAYFRGLTYRRLSEDELTIYLALHSEGGVSEVAFEMHRVDD